MGVPARRVWRDPLALALAATGCLVLLPVAAACSLAFPFVPGRCRAFLRLPVAAFAWLATYECGGLVGAFALWARRAAPPAFHRLHRRLFTSWFALVFRLSRERPHVTGEGRPAGERPVLVLSQHVGAFNGPFVAGLLSDALDLAVVPIVKSALAYDPALDVLLRRIGTPFIAPDRAGRVRALHDITRLCARAPAVLLFPEGTSFTEGRRCRGVAALRHAGREEFAGLAEELRHSLVPQLGGVQVALREAAPDVVFLAHSGIAPVLSTEARAGGDGAVRARYWVVPADEVPRGRDAQARWLFEWWSRMDDWSAGAGRDRREELAGDRGKG
ncbi:1-acyl-sn-glycerol-3-phosphate acyltransferase [Phytomonospora sp. NPDC050363]|uniref:lysophospholipid acyltransferase family protein n=1 Tax=Phytomonospora sp. NPDC050363 TaxID=3155642 RepID=UPI0033F0224D